MSEKRKPACKFVAEIYGKRIRIELFHARLWPKMFTFRERDGDRFRVRIDGTWANGHQVYTMTEVLRQLRHWAAIRLKKGKYRL